jgi:dihydrofolate reductase
MNKTISIIVAIAEDYGIGMNNKLLVHLSDDLKHFKAITAGHTVVMGRNTWLSLPKRPLPNRTNIVISNIEGENFEGATTVYSTEEAILQCPANGESFIIGGAMIYRQFFPVANKLYITRIFKKFAADTFFPEISDNEWSTESKSEIFFDENSGLNYQYVNFIRK